MLIDDNAGREFLAAELLHLSTELGVFKDILLFIGKVVFGQDGADAIAPAAAGLEIGGDFWFFHNLVKLGGRRVLSTAPPARVLLFLFAFSGTVFVEFGVLEGLGESDHLFAGAHGIVHCFGFAAEGFLAVMGGFDRKTDSAFDFVHFDDTGFDFVVHFDDVFDFGHMVLAELRDMDEAVDVVLEGHERAEVGQLGDLAFDEVADLVESVDFLPGIFVELFDAEGDALVGFVDIDDHGFDLVAFLEDFARMVDLACPAEVGDVHHAVDAFLEFHESAVGGHVANDAFDLFADDVALFDLVPRVGFELADPERDFLLLFVDAEHNGFDFLAGGENVRWACDALGPRKFGNVNKALDPGLDFHECPVGNEIRDLSFDFGAGGEAFLDLIPRVVRGLLEAEGDAFLVLVDFEDLQGDLLSHFEQFARVGEAAPSHVGDMEQAVHPAKVDERPEVGEVFHRTGDHRAHFRAVHELLAFLAALLLNEFAAAEHDIFAIVVEFDDFEVVGIADELVEILGWDDVDLRRREKRFDTDVDEQAAFDHGFDAAFDDAFVFENFADFVPVLAVGGFLLRKDDHAFVIFEADEKHLDFIADGDFGWVVEFGGRNGAFRFVADVDEKFAGTNLQDAAFDDAAFFEMFGRVGDQFFDFNHDEFRTRADNGLTLDTSVPVWFSLRDR